MNEFITEIISLVVAIIFGPMWYSEFIKRRKAEADLAVLKARKNLDEIAKKLDAEPPLIFREPAPIPDYMLDLIQPRDEFVTTDKPGSDSSPEGGPEGSDTDK